MPCVTDDGRIGENVSTKQRMLYASSKDALVKKLVGVHASLQATSFDELVEEDVINKISANRTK